MARAGGGGSSRESHRHRLRLRWCGFRLLPEMGGCFVGSVNHLPCKGSGLWPALGLWFAGRKCKARSHLLRGMALVGADGAVGAVPDDAVASADAFVVRRRQVRAAVDTLARALGSHGATYLRNVQKWERALTITGAVSVEINAALNGVTPLQQYTTGVQLR